VIKASFTLLGQYEGRLDHEQAGSVSVVIGAVAR
jgi:hypothetical protein